MKLTIGFKTPDAVDYALEEYRDYSDGSDEGKALDEDEIETAKDKLAKWIRYGESVTIEFDLTKMKAKVVER